MSSSESDGLTESARTAIGEVVGLIERYGSLPQAIVAIISLYIVESVFGFIAYTGGLLLYVFDLFLAFPLWLVNRTLPQLGTFGNELLVGLTGFGYQLRDAILGLGPAAPFVAVILGAVVMYAIGRLTIAILGELPVGSTLVDFLGLR